MSNVDILGVPFRVGDYVITGGGGNGAGEYGMILSRVLNVQPLRLIRLEKDYTDRENYRVYTRKVTVQNCSRYCVVNPPERIVSLFERAVNGSINKADTKWLLNWMHSGQNNHSTELFGRFPDSV